MMIQHSAFAATKPSHLKLNNRRQILEVFKSGASYSVADVARQIDISRQTVMKAVQFFLEKGILVSDGKAASGSMGGKRAELFSLSSRQCLFNVLICPKGLYIALFNLRCEVIDTFLLEGIEHLSVDELVARAGQSCGEMLERHGIQKSDVRGVCVPTSGIVCKHTNRLYYNSLFPDWGWDIPLAEKLSAWFEPKTLILTENVAKVCGSVYQGERACRNGRMASVFSRWGGLSACLYHEGRILNGKDSLIGEIGHMIVDSDDEVCGCGSRGCFERQVSCDRLRRLAEEMADKYPDSKLFRMSAEEMTIPDIFQASAEGDALARALSAYAAERFAAAMRNLTLVFNPDMVVFQGDYAFADDCFRETMYAALNRFKYYARSDDGQSPFVLKQDTRSVRELSTLGAYNRLLDCLFSDDTTYL